MALIEQITCRRCHKQYSSIRKRCPYCGTAKVVESTRAAQPAPAPGDRAAAARSSDVMKWRAMFCGVLVLVVIAAVIALVSVNLNEKKQAEEEAQQQEQQAVVVPSPTPTPTPTPTPEPTPTVSSLAILYNGNSMSDFTLNIGNTLQLSAEVYPLEAESLVEWSSGNEGVVTVDQTGLVTAVGTGDTELTISCGGMTASTIVRVVN